MFKSIIDRIRRYYSAVVLPNSLFQDNDALTIDEKKFFVSNILAKTESRRILEKYIRWKVGIHTRSAMRSLEDRETSKFKERAYGLAEQTIDFQNFWTEVHRLDLSEEELKKEESSEKSRFNIFKK